MGLRSSVQAYVVNFIKCSESVVCQTCVSPLHAFASEFVVAHLSHVLGLLFGQSVFLD